MRLKSFFADTVEGAIRLARQELGPDAMLVNSKRSGPEARHLGAFEVVVCAGEARTAAEPVADASPAARAAEPTDKLAREISEIKRHMERLALTLLRSSNGMSGIASDPQQARAFTMLSDAELDGELAYEIVAGMSGQPSTDALRAELAKRVHVDADLGRAGSHSRIALVGPPGAGKTSALVKLAVRYGISIQRSTHILTTDCYRIAAADQLQSYAAILGVGCQVAETPGALAQALEENRHKDLILIDTPGMSHAEMDAGEELAGFLAASPGIDTHLVLPASMRAADLRRVAEEYAVFQARKLLVTRIDETETLGPILALSIRTGRPFSFLCSGQRIPEDLEAATPDRLLDVLLRAPDAQPRQAKFGAVAA